MPPRPSPDPVPESGNQSGGLRDLLYEKARSSKRISWLLDECIRIPGTQIRFGLDPILGLIPYGGETIATAFGTAILAQAGKKGVPIATLLKMGGNMLLNAAIGVIPFAGDLFSFWFKSNSRNYRLLNSYLESDEGHEAAGGWWPLLLVVGVTLFVLLLNLLAWMLLTGVLVAFWRQVGGSLF